MKSVYNYQTNSLLYEQKNGIIFDLSLKGNITLVSGNSAVGKTLLFNELVNLHSLSSKVSGLDVSNIELFTYGDDFSFVDRECLVIIDRGEKFLTDAICKKIVACDKARFLIFTRGTHDLYVNVSSMGEFIVKENRISINYPY